MGGDKKRRKLIKTIEEFMLSSHLFERVSSDYGLNGRRSVQKVIEALEYSELVEVTFHDNRC